MNQQPINRSMQVGFSISSYLCFLAYDSVWLVHEGLTVIFFDICIAVQAFCGSFSQISTDQNRISYAIKKRHYVVFLCE